MRAFFFCSGAGSGDHPHLFLIPMRRGDFQGYRKKSIPGRIEIFSGL